jgi:hypothetical protein
VADTNNHNCYCDDNIINTLSVMELLLNRIAKRDTYTIGHLYKSTDHYITDTLEDRWRDLNKVPKVYGQTAIPEGRYRIIMTWWAKHNKYVPMLLNVPRFEGILIHAGTTDKDTEGCILVGENKVKGKLLNSLYHAAQVAELINDAIENGEKVYITII